MLYKSHLHACRMLFVVFVKQLCINLANEQLQQFFNEHIFKMELQECKEEGIMLDMDFTNNQCVVDLFLGVGTCTYLVFDHLPFKGCQLLQI